MPYMAAVANSAKQQPELSGDALILQFLGPPAHRGATPRGDAYVDREKARGYMDGVKDLTLGTEWCHPAGAPHKVHADIIEDMTKLSPTKRRGSAAPLVTEALTRRFPCKPPGVRQ